MPEETKWVTLQGNLEKIVYSNEESHYTVAQIKADDHKQPVTIVGALPLVQCGETLRLQGQWVRHPQFGDQFKIEKYESILPSTVMGLKKYLGSGLIKGIGPSFAERIVDTFGVDTLEVIDKFSGRLREVPGIGSERAGRIRLAWLEQKAVRDIMIFLQSYGITTSQASKIYKMYGEDSMRVVRENPYRLARDIYGIGFKTADQIARNMGVPSDSKIRIQAGILYQLEQLMSEGHTCFPADQLTAGAAQNLLGVEEVAVEGQISQLAHDGHLKIEPRENLVFLSGMHRAECGLVDRLHLIAQAPVTLPSVLMDKALEWADQQAKVTMSDTQRDAVRLALTSKLTVITGGPGVGKTTIVRSIVKIMAHKRARILLCAPTGRAAKRLSESCSFAAQTIHRMLKYDPSSRGFTHDGDQPLEADLVVVDETSMLDVTLAYHLFQAIPNAASVVLVGDVDQLPSVGPGNVLRDIIESKVGSVICLKEIFRQHHASQIIVNAHRVNEGKMPENIPGGHTAWRDYETGSSEDELPDLPSHRAPSSTGGITDLSDFHLLPADSPVEALKRITQLCADEIPSAFGLRPIEDIQVLAPMHRGECGIENLNRELQKALNPRRQSTQKFFGKGEDLEVERFGRIYRVGDKVMQIKNNYDLDVFNGDIGRVHSISKDDQMLEVTMDGRKIEYDMNDLDELVPAYAISIHKSQGSEYPAVVIPILTQHFVMLQRNLIYTGLTRGRKLVVLVGSPKALSIAVRNNKTAFRYGMLRARLSGDHVSAG